MGDLTQLGHYVIKGLLRHGLSADSYFAENATMRSQKVLLRVLHPETAGDPAFVRAFMEEARIAARLEHNCIATVLDLKDEGDRIYAVLEFIEGLELGELLERFGPPPPEVAVAIMRDVCSALEHAHGKSILHRRLRPRQIKVTPEGGVKVLGFGLRERESFLQSSVMPDAMREEMYRPPEQVRARVVRVPDATVTVHDDGVGRAVDERAEAGLGERELVLGVEALGDVAREPEDASVRDELGAHLEDADAAVARVEGPRGDHGLAGEELLSLDGLARELVGIDPLADPVTDQLVGGPAEHGAGGRVQPLDAQGAVGDEDPIGGVFDDRAERLVRKASLGHSVVMHTSGGPANRDACPRSRISLGG